MARSIMVEPAKLENAANKIDQQAADYESTYRKLFAEVDAMAAAWQGADNTAFTNQIKTFEDDFQKMKKLMDDYSEFLKLSAKAYREAQNEVKAQASRL
ncbi:WXG100 family type VII secretion target [Neobacillus sp. LXY-4]|uniref:WXG100 family type VII secretion target n=1 Tax=Neobacillus sp. LXY-4 TaxID=3379826 RepID=UPI003EDE90DB